MLFYNFDRIFKARAIDKPFAFLKSHGFSSSFSSKVKQNRVGRLNSRELERLCIFLKCTPNDLMEWQPDNEVVLEETHPIYKLHRPEALTDMTRLLNSIPLEKVEEINRIINEKIKE